MAWGDIGDRGASALAEALQASRLRELRVVWDFKDTVLTFL